MGTNRGNFFSQHASAARGALKRYEGPKDWRTRYSSAIDGNVMIDPSIRGLQEEGLTKNRSGLETYLGQNADLRQRYLGNQSAFRSARIDPLQRQFAQRRSELQQGIGLRGLGGSSFGDQALTGFDVDSQRAIGEAGAQAEMEDLQAISGLDQDRFSAIMETSGFDLNVAAMRLQEELSALGLGQEQINQRLQEFQEYSQRMMDRRKSIASTIVGGFGAAGKGGGGSPYAGCYIAAFHFGSWTMEHYLVARHVHHAITWKAKLARVIYKGLYPLFKALLKEARHAGY